MPTELSPVLQLNCSLNHLQVFHALALPLPILMRMLWSSKFNSRDRERSTVQLVLQLTFCCSIKVGHVFMHASQSVAVLLFVSIPGCVRLAGCFHPPTTRVFMEHVCPKVHVRGRGIWSDASASPHSVGCYHLNIIECRQWITCMMVT